MRDQVSVTGAFFALLALARFSFWVWSRLLVRRRLVKRVRHG